MDFWNSPSKHRQISEPHPKRISTPAGQRLSIILENGDTQAKTRDHRASMRKSGLASALVGDVPRESSEDKDGSGYSYSVWSDGEKFAALRNHKQIAKRGGWRKIAIIAAIVLLLIIALAVGLAVGLKKRGSSSNDNSANQPAAAAAASKSSNPSNSNPTKTSSPTAPTTLSPSALPSNFPIGSYSFITFLDTVQANCTSLSSTWTCYPYSTYNDSPTKSVVTFNWIISGSSSALKISSTENPFAIEFTNADLELVDQGKDEERYRFQLQMEKTVSPSSSITSDGAAVECDYNDTSMTAWLYTKQTKDFPDPSTGDGAGDPSFPVWPFGVRIEQTAAGGTDVPSCHKTSSPQTPLTDIVQAQDGTELCSCLYRNWKIVAPT